MQNVIAGLLAAALLAAGGAAAADATDWPSRVVKVVVPFGP